MFTRVGIERTQAGGQLQSVNVGDDDDIQVIGTYVNIDYRTRGHTGATNLTFRSKVLKSTLNTADEGTYR